MNISATFIRKPIATSMLMVAILPLGLLGYELLPVAALRNIDSPMIQVTTQLPGADAQTVAVTVAIAIVISVIVSLTLTPMMCSRLLTAEGERRPGLVSRTIEHFFDGLVAAYDRALIVAPRHRLITLMVMISTVAVTAVLFEEIPKGFFPQQDTGLIVGGLLVSQVLTLFTTPVVYIYMGRLGHWLRRHGSADRIRPGTGSHAAG